jgi:hypothetical protein
MSAGPTIKQKIIEMLQRLPDDIDYDRAIEGIYVIQRVDEALQQIERGEVYDDEEVMAELLGDHEEVQASVDRRGQG